MADQTDSILEAGDIHHTYASRGVSTPVLHGIDLAVKRGEFLLIMGQSGCGKTTLLNILGLMMPPTSGVVRIDGRSAADQSDDALTALRREKLGFVFQRFNLLPVLSAEQNVALALRLRGQSVNGQPAEVLDRVGLAAQRRKKPGELSMGQQQRVAIARAIVARPPLLFADEPTGNLDSATAADVLDLLAEINAGGQSIIMITHNEHLTNRAHRVLHMRDGRIDRESK